MTNIYLYMYTLVLDVIILLTIMNSHLFTIVIALRKVTIVQAYTWPSLASSIPSVCTTADTALTWTEDLQQFDCQTLPRCMPQPWSSFHGRRELVATTQTDRQTDTQRHSQQWNNRTLPPFPQLKLITSLISTELPQLPLMTLINLHTVISFKLKSHFS